MTGSVTHRPTRGRGLTDKFDPATAQTTSCIGKHGYASWDEADRVIRRSKRTSRKGGRKQTRASRATLHPYRCKHCHRWHISGSKG